MAASIMGGDCIFHTDDAGAGQGIWATYDGVADVTVNSVRNEGTRKDRSLDYETTHAGQRVVSVSVRLTFEAGDTQMEEIRTAHNSGADIGIGVMTGAIATTGSEGLICDAKVIEYTTEQPLEDPVTVNVTFKPSADSTYALTYTEVA